MINKRLWILNNNRESKMNKNKIITFPSKEEEKYTRKYTLRDLRMEEQDCEKKLKEVLTPISTKS